MTALTQDEFQRARTDEQRTQRRTQILQTTRDLLRGRRLADLSFNEIARQVGLAKSNVMRYFGSREAILLALLQEDYAAWVDEVALALPASPETNLVERVADVLAQTIMARPLLCELLTHLMTVLEHNVTTAEVIGFKLEIQATMLRLSDLLPPYLGEWSDAQRGLFLVGLHATVTHIWALANPSAALDAAYQANAAIGHLTVPPSDVVRELLATQLVGLGQRQPR